MGDVFQFLSSASLEKLTGRKANNLRELLDLIKTCPNSSIFYHTFSAFMKLREAKMPYNNEFALWVSKSLNERALAEKLMALDLLEYDNVKELRKHLIEMIESHIHENPLCSKKIGNEPFYLYDIMRVVYLTDKFAYDLRSFRYELAHISLYSIYYHFIESRLQTKLKNDDFSLWIEESLEMPDLAEKIRKIDISVYTMEGLRSRMLQYIDEYL
jgi:hypothetical protein